MALPHADERDLIASDISAYLEKQTNKELLRFITCGSVDAVSYTHLRSPRDMRRSRMPSSA